MKKRRRPRPIIALRGAAMADINITPMVDVLLCLLILVMVIQPGLLKGLDVQVPPPEAAGEMKTDAPRDQIVLQVRPGPAYALNQEEVSAAQLEQRIRNVFQDRARKVLFVKGTEDVSYAEVIRAIDLARGAGVRVIGLVPREPEAGKKEGAED